MIFKIRKKARIHIVIDLLMSLQFYYFVNIITFQCNTLPNYRYELDLYNAG
jgi:hypothetical protein